MELENVKKICVVGAGNMGHQISLKAAISGFKVTCTDVSNETLGKAKKFTELYLSERIKKGELGEVEVENIVKNIDFMTSLDDAAKDVDFVIEDATENLEVKRALFERLDIVCKDDAILATNSSFIVSSKLAGSTKRPDKVINMHFFDPALVMKLVEVVKGPHVSNKTCEITMGIARKMDKIPVKLKKEIRRFVVNRILDAINKEALFLLDQDIASFEDIDIAVENGLSHPMGPFKLMDLTGIDLAYLIAMGIYKETLDQSEKPSPIVAGKFALGEWGRKTGKGFYKYD